MPNVIERVGNVREKAVEVGVLLPIGAIAKVRDQIVDLDSNKVTTIYGDLVERGQERVEPLERMIRRRRRQVGRKADAATREVKSDVRKATRRAEAGADAIAPKMPRVAAPKNARELPIEKYDELTVSEITSQLKGLTQTELAKVYKYEQANDARTTVLESVEAKFVDLPIPTYDALTVDEITGRLDGMSKTDLKVLRRYENDTKQRTTVLERIDSLL